MNFEIKYKDFSMVTTDMAVWLYEAKSKCCVDAMCDGTFTHSTMGDIQDYILANTNLSPDQYSYFVDVGGWIADDRRWRAMSEEEREAELRSIKDAQDQAELLLESDPDLRNEITEMCESIGERIKQKNAEHELFTQIANNLSKEMEIEDDNG